jgi:hypothetical protein
MKYPVTDIKVGTIRADQRVARQCYNESLKITRSPYTPTRVHAISTPTTVDLDRRMDSTERRPLLEVGFIREIQYTTWLANVVLVKKPSGKWRMCTGYTDLDKACPKDSYPLLNIDQLVDSTFGFQHLSFMDAYSVYKQIRMNPIDKDKTAFIGDTSNFCYRVMSFGLKNAGATYQRLMDRQNF